jgi:hypothetical protein
MVDWIRWARRRPLLCGVVTPCLALGVFFAWRASLARHVDEQEAAMTAIAQQGGLFSLDTDFIDPPSYGPPQWLRSLIGERYFSNIVSVNLGATGATDANVRQLANLTHLQSLGIWQTHTGDAALATLTQLNELETLDMSQTDITDEGLKQIAQLTSIRTLVVGGDRLTDQGLAHLKRMSKLNMLCVVGNQFSTPAKKSLEQSLPETMVVFVPLRQFAGGAPRPPAENSNGPVGKPQQPPSPIQPPPGRKPAPVRGQFT